MGKGAVAAVARPAQVDQDLVTRFAALLRERYGAEVYVFGSRARGTAGPESDYDVVAVSDRFAEQPLVARVPERRRIFREAGGWGVPLDLHCYTRAEFAEELVGMGFLGTAARRGELVAIRPGPPEQMARQLDGRGRTGRRAARPGQNASRT